MRIATASALALWLIASGPALLARADEASKPSCRDAAVTALQQRYESAKGSAGRHRPDHPLGGPWRRRLGADDLQRDGRLRKTRQDALVVRGTGTEPGRQRRKDVVDLRSDISRSPEIPRDGGVSVRRGDSILAGRGSDRAGFRNFGTPLRSSRRRIEAATSKTELLREAAYRRESPDRRLCSRQRSFSYSAT